MSRGSTSRRGCAKNSGIEPNPYIFAHAAQWCVPTAPIAPKQRPQGGRQWPGF
jgi:hypothetical protein